MLSFLFKLANDFEIEHGYRANTLYLNKPHFEQLQEALKEIHGLEAINKILGMEIILTNDCYQPHLAWSPVEHAQVVH